LHDSTKNWTPNQWVGYSVTNYNPVYGSEGVGSYITSNTSNTITYLYYGASDTSKHMIFNAGDPYKIHRVLIMMDQNGRGKTDLIKGSGPYINTTTGTASYSHPTLEPCYSWNNVSAPNGHALGFHSPPGQPTTKLNVDYFNLGNGFPADSTPPAVSKRYTAALNGVAYTGTFTYPHPLVTGASTPTPSATPRTQQHLQKKKKNSKKLKRRNWPKKSASDMAERLARGSHFVNTKRCSHGAVRRSGRPPLNDVNAPQGRGYNILLKRFYCVAPELKGRWLRRILVIPVGVEVVLVIQRIDT
jgi:hypothetical protein